MRDAGRVIQRSWALSSPIARAVRDGVREVAVLSRGERRGSGDRARPMRAISQKVASVTGAYLGSSIESRGDLGLYRLSQHAHKRAV